MIHCSWTGGNVMMTPVVADLNADSRPEIIFTNAESSALVAIKGADCTTWFNVTAGLAARSAGFAEDLGRAEHLFEAFHPVLGHVPAAGLNLGDERLDHEVDAQRAVPA